MKKSTLTILLFILMAGFTTSNAQQARLLASPMQIVDITSFGRDTIVAVGGYLLNPVSGSPNPSCFIMRSTDAGATWQALYRERSEAQLHKLYALNDSVGFAVADSGLMYKTVDAGYTWKKVAQPTNIHLYNIEFTDSITGYATGSQEQYLKTIDGGLTWTAKGVGPSFNGLYDIEWVNDTIGYLCGEKSYRTINGGVSWSISSAPFIGWRLKQHWKNANEGWCAMFGSGYCKSVNGGQSWTVDPLVGFVDFNKFNNARFISVKDTVVYQSIDSGTTWNLIATLPENFDATSVYFTDSLVGYVGGTHKIYKTIDGGYTWNPSGYDHDFQMNRVFAFDSTTIYAVNVNSFPPSFNYTLNSGLTWNQRNITAVNSMNDIDFIDPTVGFLAAGNGLYKTIDSGATFTLVNPIVLNEIKAFDQNNLYGYDNSNYFIYSNDGGLTWINNSSLTNYPKLVKVNSTIGFALVGNSLYRSTNGGATWVNMNTFSLLPRNWDMADSLNGVARNHNSTEIYTTIDGGTNWTFKSFSNANSFFMIDPSTVVCLGGSYAISTDSGSTFTPLNFYFNREMSGLVKTPNGEVIYFGEFMALNANNGFPLCKVTANYSIRWNNMFESDFIDIPNQSTNATQYEWKINGVPVSNTTAYTFNGITVGNYVVCLKASAWPVCYEEKCSSISVEPYASQWLLRNGSNSSIYEHRASFVIDDEAFICTGEFMTSGSNTGTRLDLTDFSTKPMALLPGVARHSAIGFAINGLGYIGLGIGNGNTYLKDLWQYDPPTNTWLQRATFPGAASKGCSVVTINNKAYVINGSQYNGTAIVYYNECWEYDPATDSWLQRSSFPGAGRIYTMASVSGNKLICGGGNNATTYFNDYFQYDPATDLWTPIAAVPSNAYRTNGQTFSKNNKAYFIGGYFPSNNETTVWSYDASTSTWDSLAATIPDIFIDALCFTKGDSVLSCFPNYNGTLHARFYYYKFPPTITGIDEQTSINESKLVSIYPNPSKGTFNVRSNTKETIQKVSLYNADNKFLNAFSYSGSNSIEFNIYNDGLYFLKVETANSIIWKKVIVIK
jgi:photosystem II stability/assembly factor-like uncharacterized protein/N-acetylneuraminic acid mutarotase